MSTMGSRITEERNRLNINQSTFETFIGCPRNSLHRYEQDEIPLEGVHLQRLTAIGFDTLYIITGSRMQPMGISAEEQELIEQYRAMTKASRLKVQETGDGIAYRRNRESVRNK
ncbi:hypothetical protein PXH59_02165 [Xenorhabdus sp. SF857]|uniref:hypothetical protein n=1 Tax=Xenorhabdus bakwenae TaxID=3026967 RepID=UPI0025583420|nr:hypothetical protein [Xenorhabdus sp. SF857]WFQ80018.1 hypothetical protein PXH59_02165 [Xenorhabdus sp. SF857]